MKELNANQLESLEGGKFWGKKCHWETSPQGCTETYYCDYYALWIKVDTVPMDLRQTGLC